MSEENKHEGNQDELFETNKEEAEVSDTEKTDSDELTGPSAAAQAAEEDPEIHSENENIDSETAEVEKEIEIAQAKRIVEAVLFSVTEPITPRAIAKTIDVGGSKVVVEIIESLNEDYVRNGNSFEIVKIAMGYQMMTVPEYGPWVRRLRKTSDKIRFTRAMLDTLSIVAYKQPVMRAEIEAIRGVGTGTILHSLLERRLIKIAGRADVIGRPHLYGTTEDFLRQFGLASLKDLPTYEDFKKG